MPKEYIERGALIEELEEELAFDTPMHTDEENKFINRGLKIAIKDVNSIPTADVAEVKHGKWIKHKPDPILMDRFHEMGIGKAMNRNSIFWTCSCCGGWGTPVHNFCSNCGAKMDGKDGINDE